MINRVLTSGDVVLFHDNRKVDHSALVLIVHDADTIDLVYVSDAGSLTMATGVPHGSVTHNPDLQDTHYWRMKQ